MKTIQNLIILFSAIIILNVSCENEKLDTNQNSQTSSNYTAPSSKTALKQFTTKTFFPLEILDANCKNIYKKYGIEFEGTCYQCDLAEIKITNEKLILVNTCDTSIQKIFLIDEINNQDNKIEIKCKDLTFTFKKVEKENVFQLHVIGEIDKIENLRLLKYYTFDYNLYKFESHDCGDFQG